MCVHRAAPKETARGLTEEKSLAQGRESGQQPSACVGDSHLRVAPTGCVRFEFAAYYRCGRQVLMGAPSCGHCGETAHDRGYK